MGTLEGREAYLAAARELQPWLVSLRRFFHQNPELSGQEAGTAEKAAKLIRDMGGYEIREQLYGHGFIADIQGGEPGGTVLLRADMDALPVTEETGLPFASGHQGIMHACGHDHHISILLGAAKLLRERQPALCGRVRLLFQPAEEQAPVGGARGMIEAGALEGVSAVFGLHVWPGIPAGQVRIREGAMMAASDRIKIRFYGEQAHAAMPHLGKDALLAGCHFAIAAQSILSRNRDPMKPALLNIGKIEAGQADNVVPGACSLDGTVRTYDEETRALMERRLREIYEGICAAFSLEGEFSYRRGYDPVRNGREGMEYVVRETAALFGQEAVSVPELPAMTAEDFSFYLRERPGAFFWLGIDRKGEEAYPLHSPRFQGNEDVLWRGAALMARLALDCNDSMRL